MRTVQQMFAMILNTAREDERIRAVYMNGSRTNQHAVKDIFQDYDIVYVVTETASFLADRSWIDRFGERLYMQYPEGTERTCDTENCYGWLIQFADGNRLDLHVQALEFSRKDVKRERLCEILYDKDHCLPAILPPTDQDYWVLKPTEQQFQSVCNEFWWCLNNVAKGLWRKEVPYVQDMLNLYVRPQLITLLSWKVGWMTDFTCSVGKSGKYLYRWLTQEEWSLLLNTYASGVVEEIWESVFTMCGLFRQTADAVSQGLEFEYLENEGKASLDFLVRVQELPDAALRI